MPPHCDSLDGPVVNAARAALAAGDVDIVTPYVPEAGEAEIRASFDQTMKVRALGVEAADLADRWFFETVVRVHRAGEGAPYTGLKPVGLDVGPAIPAAERALASGSADELTSTLCAELREQVETRLAAVTSLERRADSVPTTRAYVEAALGLQVWAHGVHKQVVAAPHGHAGGRME